MTATGPEGHSSMPFRFVTHLLKSRLSVHLVTRATETVSRDTSATFLTLVGLLLYNTPTAYQQIIEFSSSSCISAGTTRLGRIQSLQHYCINDCLLA